MNSSKLCHSPEKIRVPLGFTFSALAAGIKVSGRPDLALIEAPGGAAGAALFTRNLVVAAPVEVGRASLASLAASGGRVRAVIVNSGNANRATGRAGGAAGAALFTSNLVVAAPVEVGRASLASLAASGGRVRAVIVNSGNANCATGRAGFQACERVCRDAA